MRVLHGFGASAGQPFALAEAQRKLGVDAVAVSFGKASFSHGSDLVIEPSPEAILFFFRNYARHFDVIHFHATWPFRFHRVSIVDEIVALKANGVRIVHHFRGSEARPSRDFYRLNKSNLEEESSAPLKPSWPDEKVAANVRFWTLVSDRLLAVDHEVAGWVPGSTVLERCGVDFYGRRAESRLDRLLVSHGSTSSELKGSHQIVEEFETIDPRMATLQTASQINQDEVISMFARSDLVIDQLRLGWYGVAAMEAMSLGKPVLSYIRPDLMKHLKSGGVLPTNRSALAQDLREAIGGGRKHLRELGELARLYWDAVHSPQKVAQKSLELYEELLTDGAKKLHYDEVRDLSLAWGAKPVKPVNVSAGEVALKAKVGRSSSGLGRRFVRRLESTSAGRRFVGYLRRALKV